MLEVTDEGEGGATSSSSSLEVFDFLADALVEPEPGLLVTFEVLRLRWTTQGSSWMKMGSGCRDRWRLGPIDGGEACGGAG